VAVRHRWHLDQDSLEQLDPFAVEVTLFHEQVVLRPRQRSDPDGGIEGGGDVHGRDHTDSVRHTDLVVHTPETPVPPGRTKRLTAARSAARREVG